MPVTPTYPGLYIQEAPGAPPPIAAAPTNIAVFIGYTHPLKTLTYDTPIQLFSFQDYQANFGGFIRSAAFTNAYDTNKLPGSFGDMPVAVNQFFLNGGTTAYVIGVSNGTLQNLLSPVKLSFGGITFQAREVTDESFSILVTIRPVRAVGVAGSPPADPLADIIVTQGPAPAVGTSPPTSPPSATIPTPGVGAVIESYRQVSLNPASPRFITKLIGDGTLGNQVSNLISVADVTAGATWPASTTTREFPVYLPGDTQFFEPADFTSVLQANTLLDKLPVFNLMVLPGIADNTSCGGDGSGLLILNTANAFCENKMAFLVMDPPVNVAADNLVPGYTVTIAEATADTDFPRSKNAAVYFPYLLTADPVSGSTTNIVTGKPYEIPPAATVAGVFARTDVARGVWKAPAGFQATCSNVSNVTARGQMTDPLQGTLNPTGINCIRVFPNVPPIVFGARTLAVTFDPQWTYVPVRRMALFLEQTFYANLKWVIFEPNAQPLWTAITMTITTFMLGLFNQKALQGDTPSQAFSVQCDGTTTTQADIDQGIVNIVVGFAPLKPAEFVIITIAQLAGQAQTS